MSKRIGLVGAGLMGASLARHLLSAGFSVTVHDTDPARVEALVKEGAHRAASPDRIAPRVDVVMLSLPDSHVVNAVVHDSLKLFETGREGLILIDTSAPGWIVRCR